MLCAFIRERTAKWIVLSITALCSFVFATAGIFLLMNGILPGWTFLALSLFLLPSAIREWKTPDPGIIEAVLNRSRALRRGESKQAVFVVLPSDATIGDAVSEISGSRITFLRIRDENGFFELSENDLLREAGRYGYGEPLKTLISSLTGEKSCGIIH
jgi:hypothetical protein